MPAQPITASQTGQTTNMSATSHRLLSVWLKTAMLVLLGASSGLYAAPPTIELFSGGGNTSANGPITTAQTNTYQANLNNPTDNTASTYSPTTTVTYTLGSTRNTSRYSSASGASTNNPDLMFGGTINNNSNVVTQATVYSPLNGIGAPTNANFAATLQNAPSGCTNGTACSSGTNGGIDVISNYGSGLFAATKGLDVANLSTSGRHKIGSITVTFNRAVTNPILQVAGLGGTTGNGLGFSAEFDLVSNSSLNNSIVMSRLAGSKELTVTSTRISNNASAITATTGSGGASGSVYLQGRRITSMTFDVYVRGDGGGTDWDTTNTVFGDRFFFGVSSIEADNDLSITKTQRAGTTGTFVGTQTDIVQGSTVQYRLVLANTTISPVSGATYSDVVPSAITGLSIVSTTPSSGTTCTPSLSGNTITGTYNGPAGSTCTIIVQGTASTIGLVTNTANLVENATDPDVSNNTSSVNTNIIAATNLAITKTGTTSVKAGQPVSYTIKVWNKGPAAVTDAVMTDNVPANISGPILTCVASGTATCGTFDTHVPGSNTRSATGINLPVDSTGNTNYVTYTVTGVAYQTGTFTNTASISSASVPETDSSDNSATQSTTITVDAPVTSGTASNQCSAAQAVNILTPTAFTVFDGDGAGASFTGTVAATVNNTGTVYGTGTNGAIVVSGKLSWSYGNPIVTASTLSIRINGTDYAVLTTPGSSSNGSSNRNSGTATLTALNGASVTPATLTIDNTYTSYTGRATFTLTLPTTVTSITSAQAVYLNNNPRTPTASTGDDFGVSLDSALQCQKPIVKIAKISNGGTGTFGFTSLSNLSNASGTAVTTDSVTTTTAGTSATSTQVNYATANSTAVGITESAVSGYNLTAVSCTDANSAVTSNTGSFGSLSGNTLTIPAANVKYGANLTCTFSNTKQRNLTLRKTWVNARINDAATITATGLNSFASTANTASETDTATAQAVTVGSTVTLGENISTGAGYYNATLSCTRNSDNAAVSVTGNNLTMPDADVTCGYTNSRKSASLTLQKIWANAKLNDAATITATGLTSLSAVANTASETDAAAGQTVYAGDSITLGETFSTGSASNYNATLACTGNATALTGTTLTVNPADTAITCSYTNSRIAQQLSLAKQWQNAVSGHTATATTTGGSNNATFSSTSTGNNSTNGSAVTVYAGDVVSLPAETLGGGASAAQYNSTLACSGGTTLASGAVARSITISNSTTATVCTYTNARKSATLTLSKTWASGSIAGDTATVSSSGFGNNATSGTSTATAAGNTTTGTAVTVYAGETGTIIEAFGTGTASNYNATLSCSGNSNALSGNSLTIGNTDTAINCSYTNARKTASVTLRKVWSGAATNDTATVSLKRSATTVDSLASTASAAAQTDTDTTPFSAYVGETLNLSETLGGSNAGQYTGTLSCDNGVTVAASGDFTVPATATVCTVTNTRKTRTVTVSKSLSPTTDAGKFNLIINGSTVATNIGNGGTGNVTVPVGSTVSISETAGTSTVLGNYASSLSCTGITGVTGTTSANFTQPDADVACTFSNSRRSATLTLVKQWQNGKSGDAVSIPATTGLTNNTAALASTSSGSNSTTGTSVTVYAGETATLGSETFTTGSAANYTATLSCSGATDTNLADGLTINPADTAITCTYTNARKSATLTLSKIWSAGSIAGNTATVSSSGFGNNATSGTSTATAAGNTTTGTAVTVYAGESGTISETFGTGNASNYSATLACSGNSTALSGNTLTINPADTAISCSYTNTVAGTDLAIDKTGTSSVTQGNNVSYSIKVWNKGPGVASSSTFTDTVPGALTNVSWSCSASGSAVCGTASGSGNTISVTTGTLPVNASSTAPTSGSYLTFTVSGTASTSGNITNTATIAVTSGTDPVSSNNSSSASTTISTPSAITPDTPQKEARFVITPDLPTIYRGQAGTQLVSITNQGPDDASGTVAVFKPRTQTGVTVTSVKIVNGANCSLSSGEWSCPVGSVANGGSFQLQVGYDTTASSTLGTAIQADIRVGSNEFNPGSGVGESLYNVWGSTNPNGSSQFNEIRPNGAFALGYGTANASENVNLSTAWLPTQVNPTGAYLTQAAIGGNNSVFGPSGTYSPMISRIITSLNTDTAKSQTLLALDPATQAGDNRRVWQLTTGIYVPANSTASLCIGNAGSQLDDGAYIMLNGAQVGVDGKWSSNPYIQNSVTLNTGYNRITYRIANRNTPGSNEDYAQGLYGEIGLSINGGACTAANLDATARLQIPASINIVEKQVVSISGQVFEDNSGSTAVNSNAYNGVKNTGEAAIAGSSVSITNCNSTTVATTTTDANGEYSFSLSPTDLPAGSFCIAQTNLTGYSSVSGTTGYSRATDRITVSNTGASSYSNHNFGDARLTALLSEDGQQTITAGGVADYPHRLTAQSVLTISSLNQTTSQQPANSSDQNWQAVVYRDSNCNGKVDSGESLFSQSLPLSLKNAEEVCLVQRVYAPATASMGAQHLGQLQASFSVTLADNSQITGSTLQRQDTTLLGSAGLTMQKGVRSVASCPSTAADTGNFGVQNQVQNGGYLEYEITYRNNTTKNLIDVSIKDSVPTGTVYKTASCTSTPSGSCNASHTNGALLWQTGGTLLPNQQGKVRFCVQVP